MAIGSSRWRDALTNRLARVGQDVTFTRTDVTGAKLFVTSRAFCRRTNAHEAVTGFHPSQIQTPVAQADWMIVITGEELDAAGWPLENGLPLPKRGDVVTIESQDRSVQLVTPILVDGVLVRIELTARG